MIANVRFRDVTVIDKSQALRPLPAKLRTLDCPAVILR